MNSHRFLGLAGLLLVLDDGHDHHLHLSLSLDEHWLHGRELLLQSTDLFLRRDDLVETDLKRAQHQTLLTVQLWGLDYFG